MLTMFIVLGLYSRIWNLFLHQSAPPVQSPCNPKLLNCQMMQWVPRGWVPLASSRWEQPKQHCGSEFAKWHDIYTPEECADEWRQNNSDFKLLCHEWFHHVRHHVHVGHWLWRIHHSHWTYRHFHSLFPWWRPRKIRPQRTHLCESENSAMDTWPICTKIIMAKL